MSECIETEEEFKELIQETIQTAQENFEKFPEVAHVILIPGTKGNEVVPFALLENGMMTLFGCDIDTARTGVYKFAAQKIVDLEAHGYIEISEAWMMFYRTDPGEVTTAMEKHKKLCNEHGSLKDVPGRMETLFIRGRFRKLSVMHSYKIGRRGSERYLYDHDERWETSAQGTRSAPLDRAVDKVTGVTS